MVTVAKLILAELAPLVSAQHGVFYIMENDGDVPRSRLASSYAYQQRRGLTATSASARGWWASARWREVPDPDHRRAAALCPHQLRPGQAAPRNIVVLPVIFEGEVKAIIELACSALHDIHLMFLDQLTESIGIVLNTIRPACAPRSCSSSRSRWPRSSRASSRSTPAEQQTSSGDRSTAGSSRSCELEEKAGRSQSRTRSREEPREIELAREAAAGEGRAAALISKYKSEFLANMSHELRTPLNSLLILSKMLAENRDGNLTAKQVKFAQTIHVRARPAPAHQRDPRPVEGRGRNHGRGPGPGPIRGGAPGVDSNVRAGSPGEGPCVHGAGRSADSSRDAHGLKALHQILNNLVSNACKFTEAGLVEVIIAPATSGWNETVTGLNRAHRVIAFAVRNTGIGIPQDKCKVIFEPFQQADTGTARKYGGTGLGLSISREISHLLGGGPRLTSTPGRGSTFTLYLPDAPDVPGPTRPQGVSAPKKKDSSAREQRFASPNTNARKSETGGAFTGEQDWAAVIAPTDNGIRRVLVVEDNEIERLGITTLINDESVQVTAVGTGAEALAAFADRPHDMVILDVKLPDISGIDVLRQMAVSPNFRRGQVLVYTGVELKPDEEKELASFTEAVILKNSLSPSLLLSEIRKVPQHPSVFVAARRARARGRRANRRARWQEGPDRR